MNIPMLGAYQSADDYRDHIASLSVQDTTVLSTVPMHTDLGPVMDQNKMPACVSHSITYLIRLWWFRTHGEWVDFSPRFLDILSSEPWIPLDGGRVPRTVLKVALNRGICTTKTLPNDTENLSIQQYRDPSAISSEAYAEALKYRIPGFIRIDTSPSATREALHLYGAISSLYSIGNELWLPSWKDKDIDPLRTPKSVVGGHQMTPCGVYTDSLNQVRNQWSKDWANKGEAKYDPSKWQAYTSEQWAVAAVPSDVQEFLKNLPQPSAFSYMWNTTLVQGMRSEDVKWLQIALMILGVMQPITPDQLGTYGPKTAVAVDKFQSQNGIVPVPGTVGPHTRALLNKRFAL